MRSARNGAGNSPISSESSDNTTTQSGFIYFGEGRGREGLELIVRLDKAKLQLYSTLLNFDVCPFYAQVPK